MVESYDINSTSYSNMKRIEFFVLAVSIMGTAAGVFMVVRLEHLF